ncbi:MAG: hypothetical protein IAE81_08715 [Caldilineaceae bacterium]|jgi:capsular polysaccharide biosynthesis protein|nr:hypothetical protein [Caldilineaceae bacterium]
MELREYWAILQRRWWLPVVLALLVGGLSLAQVQPWQPKTPIFSATMRMLVGVLPAAEQNLTAYDPRYYAWLTSEYLVDDFTEVVRSQLFAANVSQRLSAQNITVPAGVIQASAATGKLHRIITLSFTWRDPAQLEAIAQAAADELMQNTTFYFQQLGTDNAGVTLIDGPSISTVSPGVREQIELPLRILLAFLVGVGLVFLLYYLDDSVRNEHELNAMGIQVIGVIPKEK